MFIQILPGGRLIIYGFLSLLHSKRTSDKLSFIKIHFKFPSIYPSVTPPSGLNRTLLLNSILVMGTNQGVRMKKFFMVQAKNIDANLKYITRKKV